VIEDEHRRVDNPGWYMTINLKAMRYENLRATAIQTEDSENGWIRCFIRDLKFEGAGDPSELQTIPETFRAWIESRDRDRGTVAGTS